MAYITGTANDISALRTAIFNACTANGWMLSGEILHKGTAYFRLQVVADAITLLGGTGKDGGNNLTGAANAFSMVTGSGGVTGLVYPVTYHVHIGTAPDEVYVVLNHSTDYYQWLAFGQSHITLAAGTGNWFGATYGNSLMSGSGTLGLQAGGSSYYNTTGAFFWNSGGVVASYTTTHCHIHHGLSGGNGWNGNGGYAIEGGTPSSPPALDPLIAISPNTYNGEALLLPIPVVVRRPSSLYSLVAQPKHARYVRVDNHTPGQILTIGAEQWKVYPFMRKDTSARNGGTTVTHSGTFGWAVRYTP